MTSPNFLAPASASRMIRRVAVSIPALTLALGLTPVRAQTPQSEPPVTTGAPAAAQEPAAAPQGPDVIVRESRRGRVPGTEPELVINQAEIQALGSSNLAELLESVQNLTQARRGRGGGQPVVLLNGRRVSSFRDVARLPPEAIERIEVLPEEAALRFGFSADQRVINVILKESFTATTLEAGTRTAAEGTLSGQRYDFTFVRSSSAGRMTLDGRYQPNSGMLESERGVTGVGRPGSPDGSVRGLLAGGQIDPALSALAGRTVTLAGFAPGTGPVSLASFVAQANNPVLADQSTVRSLVSDNSTLELNGTYVIEVTETAEATLTARHTREERDSLAGYAGFDVLLPRGSAFSPFASDARVGRLLTDRAVPVIEREAETQVSRLGGTLSGRAFQTWQLALDAAWEETTRTNITRNELNNTAIAAAVAAGTLNPFGPATGFAAFRSGPRLSEDVSTVTEVIGNASGPIFEDREAGAIRLSSRLSVRDRQLESLTRSDAGENRADLSRSEGVAFVSFDVPLTKLPDEGFNFIGETGLTLSTTLRELSDFGTLQSSEVSFKWDPVPWSGFVFTGAVGDGAPSIEQLGAAVDVQPNVPVLDPVSGASVLATVTTGGNPALRAATQTDRSVTYSFRPLALLTPDSTSQTQMSIDFTYSQAEIDDQVSDFPQPSAELEAAFPDRVFRDATGRLTGLDRRPINVSRVETEQFRWAFNYGGMIGGGRGGQGNGQGAGGRPGAGGPPSGGAPAAVAAPIPGPGGSPPAGGPPAGAGPGGGGFPSGAQLTSMMRSSGGLGPPRFGINLSHTILLDQEILIRPGLPVLRPLDGEGLSGAFGVPQHTVALNANAFAFGLGFFTNVTWTSENEVVTPTTTLFFEDRLSVNLRGFVTLSQMMPFVRENTWLDGVRLILRVNNLTDSYQEVRDSNGATPLAYQRRLLEPTGRSFEFAIRKQF
jgi:iron complex outermembrane recepter protein